MSYLPLSEQQEILLFYSEKYEEFTGDLDYSFLRKVKIESILQEKLAYRYIKSVLFRKNFFYEELSEKYQLDGIYAVNDYPIKASSSKSTIVSAWIPDLQHIFYPQFFKNKRLFFRNLRIKFLIRNGRNLVVSSNDVKKHFFENFNIPDTLELHTVRFSSINDPIILDENIPQKYGISKPYFIVCNQFLKHKNHLVVLKAAKILKQKGFDFLIVLTGNTSVYSKDDYFVTLEKYIKDEGLESHINITGLIPRDEQLTLIKLSTALIQPSSFEGWSTSIEDAKSLNVPVIASDIGVHIEQMQVGGVFFKDNEPSGLSSIIESYDKNKFEYKLNYDDNIVQFARDFIKVFSNTDFKRERKILHVNASMGVGSTGRIAKSIVDLAFNAGYVSFMSFGRGFTNGQRKNLFRTNNLIDFYLHGLVSILFDRHGFGSKISTLFFISKIKKIKPDLVHLHNLHGYYIHVGVLFDYLKKNRIPTIWTQHDCWAFTGHCAHYEDISCEKWKVQCSQCPKKEKYPKSIFLDNSKKNYIDKKAIFNSLSNLTIVSPSNWLDRQLSSSFLKTVPRLIINNGVNLQVFKPFEKKMLEHLVSEFDLYDQKVILGVANVWSNAKGYHDILKLAKLLPENCILVLIGLKTSERSELPKNVLAIPRTRNMNELAKWYSLADVFVNPTYMDTFPTTNLESLACGTPVITYNSGGSPESIDNETGVILEKGDVEGIKNAILNIIEKGKKEYQNVCRNRAEVLYNQELKFKEYITLYQSIIGS